MRLVSWLRLAPGLGAGVVVLVTFGCTNDEFIVEPQRGQPGASAHEVRTLSTGKEIRVVDEYEETDPSEERTLVFEYLTDFDIPAHHESLQREVEEIWTDLLADAERRKVTRVYIVPTRPVPEEPPPQGGPVASGMWFRLKKDPDGRWQKEGGFAFPSPDPAAPTKR